MNNQDIDLAIAYRDNLRAKKRQLEDNILSLLETFQLETGLRVTDINFDFVYQGEARLSSTVTIEAQL